MSGIMSLRQYLQYHTNNHPSQTKRNEAQALLNKVGDDGKLDANFLTGEKHGLFGAQTREQTSNGYTASALNRNILPWWADSYNKYVEANKGGGEGPGVIPGPSGGWGSWGGGSSTEARDRADAIARYDEEIRQASDAMAGLGRKEEIGIANINKSIHNANIQADNDFGVAKGKYQMQTNDAINQHRKTRDQIESDAADKIRSARGIFAAGGSGDSSFSKTLAPFKISEAASKQQGQVQDTYAKNRRDMDINYMAVENAYKANKKRIHDEGDQRINSLRQKIATTRQDLEGRIRNANIGKSQARGSSLASAIASQNASRDRINAMSGEIDELGRDRSIAIDKVQWKAPELSSYDPKDVTVRSADPNAEVGGVNDQIAPNLQPLLDPENKKKKETGMF